MLSEGRKDFASLKNKISLQIVYIDLGSEKSKLLVHSIFKNSFSSELVFPTIK